MPHKLTALFQPQQWIQDWATDSSPAVKFDAGLALLSMSADQVRYIHKQAHLSTGRDLDALAEIAGLAGEGPDMHDGPFEVSIDDIDLDDYLFEIGIRDLSKLSDTDLEDLKNQHYPAAPQPGM